LDLNRFDFQFCNLKAELLALVSRTLEEPQVKTSKMPISLASRTIIRFNVKVNYESPEPFRNRSLRELMNENPAMRAARASEPNQMLETLFSFSV
jgi:hypothetical protein